MVSSSEDEGMAEDLFGPEEVEAAAEKDDECADWTDDFIVSDEKKVDKDGGDDGDEADLTCAPCTTGRRPKTLKSPVRPSAEAVEEHYATHFPYRNWCAVCVKAKGVEDAHRRAKRYEQKEFDGELKIVGIDYNSIDEKAMSTSEELCKLKTMVIKDEATGVVFQHVAPKKGPSDEWLMKRVCRDIEELGHSDMILKTDGEPAIVAVQAEVQSRRKARTVPRNPPAYDPKSNGPIEKAVRDTAEHSRALKLGLEERLKGHVPIGAGIVEWILEHAAFLISKYSVGHDGMTPHERATGHKWHRPLVEIGEVVLAKLIGKRKYKGKKDKRKKKLAALSIEAIWTGQCARTGEHLVVIPGGDAFRCRTVRRVPVEERWNLEKVLQVKAVPRRPTPSREDASAIGPKFADEQAKRYEQDAKRYEQDGRPPRRPHAPAQQDEEPLESGAGLVHPEVRDADVRDFRITEQVLSKYGGYLDGCPGCEHKAAGHPGHRGHTQECRKRLQERMQQDPDGQTILREARRRREELPAVETEKSASPGQGHGAAAATTPAAESTPAQRLEPQGPGVTSKAKDDENEEKIVEDVKESDEEDEGVGEDLEEIGELTEENVAESMRGAKRGKQDEPREDDDDGMMKSDEDEEPNTKRAKLKSLQTEITVTTEDERGKVISRSEGVSKRGHARPSPAALGKCPEKAAEARMLAALREHTEVRTILAEIEQNFKAKDAAKRRSSVHHDGKMDIAEVYSPPRVTETAAKMGLKPGWALDLTQVDEEDGQRWDFSVEAKRKKAKEKIKNDKPFMLIVCPMCGPFSSASNFNYINKTKEEVKDQLEKAMDHINFAVELCIMQLNAGRLFLFEHPAGASTWETKVMKSLRAREGVLRVNFDFCMAGMKIGDKKGDENPVKKRTGLVTNSHALYTLFREAQCRGDHVHAEILSRTAECQVYPEKFCEILCEGVKRELSTIKWRNRLCEEYDITETFEKLLSVHEKYEPMQTPAEEDPFATLYDGLEFRDDISGAPLDKEEAIKARRKEIEFFKRLGVYTKVPKERWMRVITTRWIDQNKGDENDPNYRARLVAREINRMKRDDLFAATPPLESLRMIVSKCAANQHYTEESDRYIIMYNDVKRAYFHAPAKRPVYIKIPAEDFEAGDEDMVGVLNLSLYGTRDAAMNWAAKYTEVMTKAGFRTGKASPCNFYHQARDISVTVHGDDFTSTGSPRNLRWLEMKLKEQFELVTETFGAGKGHNQQLRILNRVISWSDEGIQYEADQRHAEIIIQELGLSDARPLATPGTREDAGRAGPPTLTTTTTATATTAYNHEAKRDVTTISSTAADDSIEANWERHGEEVDSAAKRYEQKGKRYEQKVDSSEALLGSTEARMFRGLAARLNYLAQDRPDLQYSAKEISRRMARPSQRDWALLKRAGRYLVGAPRAVHTFFWQREQTLLETSVDSDWAGCTSTCRSTSGGVVRLGSHLIKSWSSTQATVAMSSAEAELFSLTKGAAVSLGLMSVAKDLGIKVDAKIYSDASAALAISQRQGLGKLRHLKVQFLWVQERIRSGDLTVQKVAGVDNPADLLTKHLGVADMRRHVEALGIQTSRSRAAAAPRLSATSSGPSATSSGDGHEEWQRGDDGTICMVHRVPRTCLFTPLRVKGAPPLKSLTAARETRGTFCDNGAKFLRRDNWTSRATAHADMHRRWIGTTTFILRTQEDAE